MTENTAIQPSTNSIETSMPNTQHCETSCHTQWTYQPEVDVIETADSYVFLADMPGATIEQVNVTLEGPALTIHAEVPPRAHPNARLLHQTYGVGPYHRRFDLGALADEVASDNVNATLTNGVLNITLGKRPQAKPRKIEIKAA